MNKKAILLSTTAPRFFIYLVGFICLIFLSGCAQFGIGQTEYGCQGMPNGVKCLSASQVYALAESKNRPVDQPQFISVNGLEDSTTVRVWIAKWEDDDGDIYEGHFLNLSR